MAICRLFYPPLEALVACVLISWSGFDLPLENRFESFPRPTESKVIEYVPESRIGWVSYATSTVYGPICDSYHNWFLTPNGAKRCHVIFEEIATGWQRNMHEGTMSRYFTSAINDGWKR